MSKVAVGMSGGVDSSVTVHLLQAAGHEVVGIHMKLIPETGRDAQATDDARAVAEQFGIDFHVLDARDAFNTHVMAPFAEAYLKGDTPNPCVLCNPTIKFGVLWEKAQQLGCTHLATGHYAQILNQDGHYTLARGIDQKKDQSYFLWRVPSEMLAHLLFPMGAYTKDETRAIAEKLGLLTAKKKESQEICFIPEDDYSAFLADYCPERLPKFGHFVDTNGTVIGKHEGAYHYTIGQRRGLGLALGYPAYVTAIDAKNGHVTIGHDADLWHQALIADHTNLLTDKTSGTAIARIRSRDGGTSAHWEINAEGQLIVRFDTPVRAITPGQSVVLYEGNTLIAGGLILTHID